MLWQWLSFKAIIYKLWFCDIIAINSEASYKDIDFILIQEDL
ncbi:hypothetical protein SpAn4DRAFT_0278 [Sporomusa ovata]|uniref:Uncharacterized protein n=1 Tax=Sporomusa ovata TaxID=2378 RepID=A0A0U1L2E5_9FIRM|nr:hypothetical protein SpAn4DRAFT_0278 [Sporomusa ovata]